MVMRVYSRYFACWRVLPFWVVILLLCSSCTKDEPVYEDVAIGFGARMSGNAEQQGTKLLPDATVFEKEVDMMGVYGYLVHNGTYGTDDDVAYSAPYISNGVIEYDAAESQSTGKDLWHFNPARYWPNMGYEAMNFYAYWPYVASSPAAGSPDLTVNEQEGSYPYFSYKTDVAGGASKEDFLVAQASGWREIVDLDFKRPLAKVVWKVKYNDFIGTNGIDLNIPVISKASFKYNDTGAEDGKGWVYDKGHDSNTDISDLDHLMLSYKSFIAGNYTDPVTVATCYLIPQQIKTFSVVYNYHKEARDISSVEDFNLQAGYSYEFTLSIQKEHVIRIESQITDKKGNNYTNQWITIENNNNI